LPVAWKAANGTSDQSDTNPVRTEFLYNLRTYVYYASKLY
jgi:hypothetical protein